MRLIHLSRSVFNTVLLLAILVFVAPTLSADEDKPAYTVAPVEGFTTEANLFAIRAIDAKSYVMAGSAGFLARSDDGGKKWRVLKSGTDADLHDVRFVSPLIGVAAGDGGKYPDSDFNNPKPGDSLISGNRCYSTILRTGDGGKTWTRIEAPTNLSLMSVLWLDKQRALIASGDYTNRQPFNGDLLMTEDTGKTWKVFYHLGSPCHALALGADRTGWVVGAPGRRADKIKWNGKEIVSLQDLTPAELKVLPLDFKRLFTLPEDWNATALALKGDPKKSPTQANVTADVARLGGGRNLYGLHLTADRAWVVGEESTILISERKGKAWQPWRKIELEGEDKPDFRAIAFRDARTAIVVGDSGSCLYTLDGGKKWARLNLGVERHLNAVTFVGATALVAGNEGTLLRLTPAAAK